MLRTRKLRTRKFQKQLSFELLESRCLLSGTVLADVAGGTLYLRGDTGNNSVTIEATTTADQFTVTGSSTTINGSTSPFTANGVTRDLNVRFLNGSDSLTVTGSISIIVPHALERGVGRDDAAAVPGPAAKHRLWK